MNDDESLRLFFAIPVPQSFFEHIYRIQDIFSSSGTIIWRPTQEHQFHLTLLFLGELSRSLLPRLLEKANRVLHWSEEVSLEQRGVSQFPMTQSRKPPKIIHVQFARCPALEVLRKKLQDSLSALPLKKNRKSFIPHLTLGRVKKLQNSYKFEKLLTEINCAGLGNGQSIPVKEIILFESELKPSGAVYHEIQAFPLVTG
ncbi:RNA 2',3'-cyclic phosphodiesterase [Candidatus Riflebacteria bacterium]